MMSEESGFLSNVVHLPFSERERVHKLQAPSRLVGISPSTLPVFVLGLSNSIALTVVSPNLGAC